MSAPRRSRRGGARSSVKIPSAKLPRLTSIPRNPPGWSHSDIRTRTRGPAYVSKMKKPEPAGEPPGSFSGTRPEWAIYWACLQNGMKENEDFLFTPGIASLGVSYFSTVDFLFPDWFIAIEVQGEFWHVGQGSERIFHDLQRGALLQERGVDLIHVDAEQALADPEYYLDEALEGRSHSELARGT